MLEVTVEDRKSLVSRYEAIIERCREQTSDWFLKASNILSELKKSLVEMAEEDFLTAINFFWHYILPQGPKEVIAAI